MARCGPAVTTDLSLPNLLPAGRSTRPPNAARSHGTSSRPHSGRGRARRATPSPPVPWNSRWDDRIRLREERLTMDTTTTTPIPRIGHPAPDFTAVTTQGELTFSQWAEGKWV